MSLSSPSCCSAFCCVLPQYVPHSRHERFNIQGSCVHIFTWWQMKNMLFFHWRNCDLNKWSSIMSSCLLLSPIMPGTSIKIKTLLQAYPRWSQQPVCRHLRRILWWLKTKYVFTLSFWCFVLFFLNSGHRAHGETALVFCTRCTEELLWGNVVREMLKSCMADCFATSPLIHSSIISYNHPEFIEIISDDMDTLIYEQNVLYIVHTPYFSCNSNKVLMSFCTPAVGKYFYIFDIFS